MIFRFHLSFSDARAESPPNDTGGHRLKRNGPAGGLARFGRLFRTAVVFFTFFFVLIAGNASVSAQEKVRVGYFEFEGYHRQEEREDGTIRRSGYGYELLQMLLPYTNWEYEYIGYERGWPAMLPMLENGEIDLLTSTVKIPEKEAKFDFSTLPVGTSSVIMTVKAGCARYLPHDYEHWSGIKVGVLRDNSKNDVFSEFAKEKGFAYQEVEFSRTDALNEALQDGTVDAVVSGNLRRLQNEWLYEQLDIRPFYIIVKKGNQKLLDELNSALERMEIDYPAFSTELRTKYFNLNMEGVEELSFSLEERDFRQECRDKNIKFSVLVNPDRYPFSYVENGRFAGIMMTLLNKVETRTGLDFEMEIPLSREEYYRRVDERGADIVIDFQNDMSTAERRGYILTRPYLTAMFARIFRKSAPRKMNSCAIVRESDMAKLILPNLPNLSKIEQIQCPTQDSVIAAVKLGRADFGFVYDRTAEEAIMNDHSGVLSLAPTGYVIQFSYAVKKERDRRLMGMISKALRSLSEEEIQQAILADDLRLPRHPTFRDLVTENPLTVSLSLIGLVLFLGGALLVVIIYHRRAAKSDAELTKKSRLWNLVINSLPLLAFIKDAENGFRYTIANKELGLFHKRDADEILGKDDFELLGDEAAEIRKNDEDCINGPPEGIEKIYTFKREDGTVRQLHMHKVPYADEDGHRLLIGLGIDVTELQTAKSRAEESAERLKKTLISIGDAVMATDVEGKITLLNPIAERLLGSAFADCRGKRHADYFKMLSYPDDAEMPSPVEQVLSTGEIVTLANHADLVSKDGRRYHIAVSAAPILAGSGEIAGAILVFRDVTEEYNLKEKLRTTADQLREALALAQQASEAKGVFLSQMSHEIRTPLNAMIGYLNIARESGGDRAKIGDCLDKGISASTHLLSIINSILDISAIEKGKLKIANEDFDFKHLLTGVVSMFYAQAENKNIRFELSLQDLTEEWLVGDSVRVNQVLLNLLSNAMKFTPSGGSITLIVKQIGIIQNRVQLMLRVIDTGCGMSEEFSSRVFRPFEQQDASTVRKYGGTGLGLSITKNLVTLMGGTIEVESQENVGTTFTVHLPFDKSAKTESAADADFSKLRALVVDDQQEDRSYLQLILKKIGVMSDSVESGEAAVRQFERRLASRHPYDLCLMDLRLAGIDGIETARQMRRLNDNPNVPIILVTAYDAAAIANDALDAGVSKVIPKPLFQSTLFDFLMNTYYYGLQEKKNHQEIQSALAGTSILLAEDNQMNMDISTQYLQRAGMKITPVWNGKEAYDLFVRSAPGAFQAILMDIQMPVMDGYEATAKIRASAHPEAKTIPIIAMTANAFNEDVVRALSAGMNDHISKPVFYDRLFASLSKLTQTNLKPTQKEDEQ